MVAQKTLEGSGCATRILPHPMPGALVLCRVLRRKAKSGKKRLSASNKKKASSYQRVTLKNMSHADLFAHGVSLFNSRHFFEAHEAWEEIWLHTERPEKTFLQGLIQVTAAFHHHSRRNLHGTESLLRAGLEKLEPFPPHHRDLRIDRLRASVRHWLSALAREKQERRPSLPRLLKFVEN
jgi:predicted metal-dependent hydrolase